LRKNAKGKKFVSSGIRGYAEMRKLFKSTWGVARENEGREGGGGVPKEGCFEW